MAHVLLIFNFLVMIYVNINDEYRVIAQLYNFYPPQYYIADHTRVTMHFLRWRVKMISKRER